MSVFQPIFWPPKKNCLRCDSPYDAEKGGIGQFDYLFLCPDCAVYVIPNLVKDLRELGFPYSSSLRKLKPSQLKMLVEAGQDAAFILEAMKNKANEN